MAIDEKKFFKLDSGMLKSIQLPVIEKFKSCAKSTDYALAYRVYRSTVFLLLSDFYKHCKQARQEKPISGRPLKLDEPRIPSLVQTVTDQTPLAHCFKFLLRPPAILRKLIRYYLRQTMVLSSVIRVDAGHHCAETALGLVAGLRASTSIENQGVFLYQSETIENSILAYFSNQKDICIEYHTSASWALAEQTSIVAVLLSQKIHEFKHQRRVWLNVAPRHVYGTGVLESVKLPASGFSLYCDRGDPRSSHTQDRLGVIVHRELGRKTPVYSSCRRTRSTQPRQTNLSSC